jgi:hypothetical protein
MKSLRSSPSLQQLLDATSHSTPAVRTETATLVTTGAMPPDSPAPVYTPSSTVSTPSSVFTLRHTKDGKVELTANRKIIRITLGHSTETFKEGTYKLITNVTADIIPTNNEVLQQVVQDVYNDQTQAVLHAPDKKKEGSKKWWFGKR